MTNTEILYKFLDDNLMFGDIKQVSVKLNLSIVTGPSSVSRVKNALKKGKRKSKRILKALEAKALENFNHAQQIAQYSNQRTQL